MYNNLPFVDYHLLDIENDVVLASAMQSLLKESFTRCITKFVKATDCSSTKGFILGRMCSTIPLHDPPPNFDHIELPEQRKLPVMQKVPYMYTVQKAPRVRKLKSDIRGPEVIQNKLLHKQYGIVALGGGFLDYVHFEVIRNGINRFLDIRKTFAVWRVDPPWKPVSRKSIGKRMGGGKANVHHYTTPIKAGRIIIEIGGKVEYEEVRPLLTSVAHKLPFPAMAVSQEILKEMEDELKHIKENNINPLSFTYCVKNNIQGCNLWTSPYDLQYGGDYVN